MASLLSMAILAGSAGMGLPTGDGPPARESAVRLIVQAASPAVARRVVEAAGGRVTRDLPIVGGVAATVPGTAVPSLAGAGVAVSPDLPLELYGAWEDPGIPHRVQSVVRADDLWRAGTTGAGTTVALLDTGVYAAHPDLQGTSGSRVIHCEDFSSEAGTAAHCADTFGHGTFMAGLIAGDGASSKGKYVGAAPEANLVSIKVAGFDGATDVSTVLAGIQWAVAFRQIYRIQALNLSLGTDSAQDYRISPLNHAVERAWSSGIAVVVSAGNTGPASSTITKPGDDPYVVTVGASNDQGTVASDDDTVPVFSARGPTRSNGLTKPDVVAPGVHTISLRSPGSAIDQRYGAQAAVDGDYFRGTGTSMSTATVTGVVAQILQREPGLNPNQVKHRLMSTARTVKESNPLAVGSGAVDAWAASNAGTFAEANQGTTRSSGLGLIQHDRGTVEVEVATPAGQAVLTGEYSAQSSSVRLVSFSSLAYVLGGWDPSSWRSTVWETEDWAAMTWKGMTWKATVWDGMTWKGMTWKNADWDAMTWKNADWDAMTWKNADWDAMTWKGVDWDAMTWKASNWQTAWYAAAWD